MIRWTRCAGFTLIELIIAVAVIALLAAIAYPSYREILMRSRRTDAVTSLLELRVAQEKWRANHTAYAALDELNMPAVTADGYYELRMESNTASGFFATATPQPGGQQQGDACGTFAIDQRGPLLTQAYADAVCWQR